MMDPKEVKLALDAHVRALDATVKTRARLDMMWHCAIAEARVGLINGRRYLPQFVGLTFRNGSWS